MVEQNEKQEVGEWNSYLDNFLRADDVESISQLWDVIDTEQVEYDGTRKIRLHLKREGRVFLLDLNKTNTIFLKEQGLKHPADIVGCKVSFRKVMVHNPTTNKEVESLRIVKVVGIVKNEKVGE